MAKLIFISFNFSRETDFSEGEKMKSQNSIRRYFSFIIITLVLVSVGEWAYADSGSFQSANTLTSNLFQNTIPNFLQVNDSIFRGGRPNNGDLQLIQKEESIKTVINLENIKSFISQEKQVAIRLGLKFFSSPMDAGVQPNDQQINQILDALKNINNFPIFIHCHHGQDRTGLIIGLYRVEVQGWTPAKAYQEMLDAGFHPSIATLDDYFKHRTGFTGQ